jgi:NRPS condensation-like uncharacterized protein
LPPTVSPTNDHTSDALPDERSAPESNARDGRQTCSGFDESTLFPLRLSDFEYYMFTDDRPTHPMVFVMVANIRGQLDETAFRTSLDELLKSHPLLRCRIQHMAKIGWSWVLQTDPLIARRCVSWKLVGEAEVCRFSPRVRAINIQENVGFFIEAVVGPESAQVVLHLHHCCTDGIGGLQLVGELFARYGQQTAAATAKQPEIDVIDPSKLLLRENCEAGEAAAQRQKKSIWKIAGKISRLMFRAPVTLGINTPATSSIAHENSAIQSRVLARSTYRALRAVAANRGVSLNDMLLAEMILHIRDWNRRAGVSMKGRWIRLAVPLSMRTSRHEGISCTNIVSYALVTRREEECDDEPQLLKSIHQQTSDVLFNREGMVCLKLFRVLRKIPGAMKAFLGSKSVFSTMVLANIGDVRKRFGGRFPLDKGRWVAGNVVVENIHGVAPVRPNTRAAMSIGDYAGELSMSLRTDGTVMGAEESERFLSEFIQRLVCRIGAVKDPNGEMTSCSED